MTKAQRERVRRHAAVVAIAPKLAPVDPEAQRLEGLRRWREPEPARPKAITLRLRTSDQD